MNLAAWLIFGVIIGIISHIWEPHKGGILSSIILGILGATLGGFLANLLFGSNLTGFSMTSLFVASMSALLIVFGQKFMVKKDETI
jgi:uncharacterized membrane protein YeaQ/YmgE (transglycosylase-associated protein family)